MICMQFHQKELLGVYTLNPDPGIASSSTKDKGEISNDHRMTFTCFLSSAYFRAGTGIHISFALRYTSNGRKHLSVSQNLPAAAIADLHQYRPQYMRRTLFTVSWYELINVDIRNFKL